MSVLSGVLTLNARKTLKVVDSFKPREFLWLFFICMLYNGGTKENWRQV